VRVLLDEHLDRRLRRLFDPAHEVVTVGERGWSGMKDGALLEAAQKEFNVLITMDRGIAHQQNLHGLSLGIVVLRAHSNRRADTSPLIPQVNAILRMIGPGELVEVEPES